jgi:hypothetical protein
MRISWCPQLARCCCALHGSSLHMLLLVLMLGLVLAQALALLLWIGRCG